jgi:small subunit ribosomal protein S20
MAITKNAQKAIRTSARKRVINVRRKASLHGSVKEFRSFVAGGDIKQAEAFLSTVYKELDKAAKRGIIKQNTANRKKSRLVSSLRKNAK